MGLTDKEAYLFDKCMGMMVTLELSSNYSGYMSQIYDELGKNGMRNKCDDFTQRCEKMKTLIKVDIKNFEKVINKLYEFNMDLISDTLHLNDTNQQRVYSLVQKLKKEEKRNVNS